MGGITARARREAVTNAMAVPRTFICHPFGWSCLLALTLVYEVPGLFLFGYRSLRGRARKVLHRYGDRTRGSATTRHSGPPHRVVRRPAFRRAALSVRPSLPAASP